MPADQFHQALFQPAALVADLGKAGGNDDEAADLLLRTLLDHVEHGIAKYGGLVKMEREGTEREYMLLLYAEGDRLYVPADQTDRLDKALTAAGVRHRGEVYAGAHHGFTQADTAMHSPEATERHWTALLNLLARTL